MVRGSRWNSEDSRGLREPFGVPRGIQGSLFSRPLRNPVAALVLGSLMTVGALALVTFTVVHLVRGTEGVSPWLLVPVGLAALGSVGGLTIGIMRVRWSRRYRAATGKRMRDDSDDWKRHVIR